MSLMRLEGITSNEFEKAKGYLSRLQILDQDPQQVFAHVHGSNHNMYSTMIRVDGEQEIVFGRCTCPAFTRNARCKHIAALILKSQKSLYDEIGPHFRFKSLDYDVFYDMLDDEFHKGPTSIEDESTISHLISTVRQDLRQTQEQYTPKVEEFYQKKQLNIKSPYVIWYELEIYERFDDVFVRFNLLCQSKLKTGNLGKVKKIKLEQDSIKSLPLVQDQKLVTSLAGFARWDYNYAKEKSFFDSGEFSMSQNRELFIEILKSKRALTTVSYPDYEQKMLSFVEKELRISLNIKSAYRQIDLEFYHEDKLIALGGDGFTYYADALLLALDTQFYPIMHSSEIPVSIMEMLIKMAKEENVIHEHDWKEIQKIIVQYIPHHLLAGDAFHLDFKEQEKAFDIYLKWEEGTRLVRGLINLKNENYHGDNLIHLNDQKFKDFLIFLNHHDVEIDHREQTFLFNATQTYFICQYLEQKNINVYFKKQAIKVANNIQINTVSGINWLELDPTLEFQQEKLQVSKILNKLDLANNSIPLGENTIGILPIEWVKNIQKIQKHALLDQGKFKLHPAKALLLSDIDPNQFDHEILKLKTSLQNFDKVLPQEAPINFKGHLRDYQKLSLGWFDFLESCSFGGCLADDMGLGKTVQVIAHMAKKFLVKSDLKVLIISPKSLVFNWYNEIERFCPQLKVHSWNKGKLDKKTYEENNIILVSYPLLQRQTNFNFEFDQLILDEAQYIKNSSSLTHKAVAKISAKFKLALTGTPVENHAGDLMSIFNIVIPGLFHSKNIKDPQALEDFHFIKPFLLRRTKEEVLKDLPSKSIQTIYCEQTAAEQKEYLAIHQALRTQIKSEGVEENKFNFLQVLTKLRQAACSLQLIDPTTRVSSSKLETLKELVAEIHSSNEKVIIFSQFTRLLKLARAELEMNDTNSAYLDGQTKKRDEVIENFKFNPDIKTFFISIKAGGVGLNLTNTNYCIILDPWWNPAVESQAIDRIHRIGQTKSVFAYRLISKNTIEEKVSLLQKKKRELYQKILNNNEGFIRGLTKSDIQFLLD